MEPSKPAPPKAKMPPSAATKRYPLAAVKAGATEGALDADPSTVVPMNVAATMDATTSAVTRRRWPVKPG
jgi:hypothetical protein